MGIGVLLEEGAVGPFIAFANDARANSAQQLRKTLILRRKTRSGRFTPSLWIVVAPIDKRLAINPDANKAKTKRLTKSTYFCRIMRLSQYASRKSCIILLDEYICR